MAVDDPWGELSTRYMHDEDAQFCLFIEQFAETADLIRAAGVAKLRMSLVALDNLAEVLLHRHRRRSVRCSEESGWPKTRRFTTTELARLRSDFGTRISLAASEQKFSWYTLPRILDPLDESIFRVAHTYRNRVYHADHHNATLLPLLTRAYLVAIGRAFVRSQPVNVGGSNTPSTIDLAEFGYKPRPDSIFPGYFVPSEAAETIVTHVVSGLDVKLPEARSSLQLDLRERVDWIRAMISDLLGGGMPSERFSFAIRWSEFWNKHGADDELARLDEQRVAIMRAAMNGEASDDQTAAEEAETAYLRRIHELQEEFMPSVHLDALDHYIRLAERLSSARTLGVLFTRYQNLDQSIEDIERVIADVAIGWDRWIQEETDRLRGK